MTPVAATGAGPLPVVAPLPPPCVIFLPGLYVDDPTPRLQEELLLLLLLQLPLLLLPLAGAWQEQKIVWG